MWLFLSGKIFSQKSACSDRNKIKNILNPSHKTLHKLKYFNVSECPCTVVSFSVNKGPRWLKQYKTN